MSSAKDELPRHWFVTEGLLARCPNLLCVSSNGAGYDTIDVAACTRAGVLVVNQAGRQRAVRRGARDRPDARRDARISENDRLLRTERGYSREDIMGLEMSGKVVGLVGIGHIGTPRREARAGVRHGGAGRRSLPDRGGNRRRGATAVSFEELLARSDFVSLHCPRDQDTLKMMNAAAFARMKKGAVFVTTARGGIHDEAALLDALTSGHLYGAGLDVWEKEPPPLDHPLLKQRNVVATYHTGGRHVRGAAQHGDVRGRADRRRPQGRASRRA